MCPNGAIKRRIIRWGCLFGAEPCDRLPGDFSRYLCSLPHTKLASACASYRSLAVDICYTLWQNWAFLRAKWEFWSSETACDGLESSCSWRMRLSSSASFVTRVSGAAMILVSFPHCRPISNGAGHVPFPALCRDFGGLFAGFIEHL